MRHRPIILALLLLAVTACSDFASKPAPRHYSQTAGNPMAVIDSGSHKQYINSVCVSPAGTWLRIPPLSVFRAFGDRKRLPDNH